MRMEIELCTIPTTTACAISLAQNPSKLNSKKLPDPVCSRAAKQREQANFTRKAREGGRTREPCARIPFFHMSHIPWGYARQSEGYNKYHPYKLVSAKHATNKYWRCVNVEDTCHGPSNWHMFASSCERCAPKYTYYIPPPFNCCSFSYIMRKLRRNRELHTVCGFCGRPNPKRDKPNTHTKKKQTSSCVALLVSLSLPVAPRFVI